MKRIYKMNVVKYSYADACRNIFNAIRTSRHSSLGKYTSHFIWKGSKGFRKVLSVRGELETEQNCNILTPPTLLATATFLSRSPGLINWRPGSPASAGTWFSFQHLSPTDMNFLSPGLYNNLPTTYFLRGCPRGVMVKAMNCGIVVREFVLQSRYYVHFRANPLGKGMNPLILPPAMGK